MIVQSARARRLRDSYIEISRYVRAQIQHQHLESEGIVRQSCFRIRHSSTLVRQHARAQAPQSQSPGARRAGTLSASQHAVPTQVQLECLKRFERSCESFNLSTSRTSC